MEAGNLGVAPDNANAKAKRTSQVVSVAGGRVQQDDMLSALNSRGGLLTFPAFAGAD